MRSQFPESYLYISILNKYLDNIHYNYTKVRILLFWLLADNNAIYCWYLGYFDTGYLGFARVGMREAFLVELFEDEAIEGLTKLQQS